MNDKTTVHEEQADWVGEIAKDSQSLANLQNQYNGERDLLNQLLGQAQMATAFEDFSRTVRTSKMAYVKENKLYKALKGQKTPNCSEFLSGTWDEFCRLMGSSADKVDLDIANLKVFGEEALESMSRMGIGYRELRQYRKLSDDQKTALIEVAKAGDKESFVELAEEIMVKHSREKESLNKQVAELTANTQAKDTLLAKKDEKLNELDAELTKRTQLTPDAQLLEQQEREHISLLALQQAQSTLLLAVQQFHQTINAISQNSNGSNMDEALQHTMNFVYQSIAQVASASNIAIDFTEMVSPSWLQDALKQQQGN